MVFHHPGEMELEHRNQDQQYGEDPNQTFELHTGLCLLLKIPEHTAAMRYEPGRAKICFF
jgi:hypothetical protein